MRLEGHGKVKEFCKKVPRFHSVTSNGWWDTWTANSPVGVTP